MFNEHFSTLIGLLRVLVALGALGAIALVAIAWGVFLLRQDVRRSLAERCVRRTVFRSPRDDDYLREETGDWI